uniref:hypothetical protein n=1 Tax=Treponema zioleckii TaxID=331680 RepID=UPI00168A69F7
QELEKSEDINENEFNKKEKEIENEENKKYEQVYKTELTEYEQIFNPSQDWLEEKFDEYHKRIVEKWGGKVWVASGASIYFEKNNLNENKYSISIMVDNLTEYAQRFPYKYSITAAGNLSQRLKTEKQIDEEYAQNVCALAFVYALCLFNVCFDAKEVLTSCCVNHIDASTGNEESRYLYSVIIPRNLVKKYKMENLNAVAALMSLEGSADIRKEREIYFIAPMEWKLDVQTQQEDESVDEVIIDFRRLNTKLSLPPEFEIGANLIEEKVNNIKQLFKDKLIEFDIIADEFEADNYVAGLCNLLVALTLLKQNDSLFESENCEQLYDELDKIFSNNKYAMGEIKKIN